MNTSTKKISKIGGMTLAFIAGFFLLWQMQVFAASMQWYFNNNTQTWWIKCDTDGDGDTDWGAEGTGNVLDLLGYLEDCDGLGVATWGFGLKQVTINDTRPSDPMMKNTTNVTVHSQQ